MLLAMNPVAFANSSSNEKDKVELDRKNDNPERDEGNTPEVNYDNEKGVLDIAYESSDNCYVEVKNSNSYTVYKSPILTTGVSVGYYINLLQNNYYMITITSSCGDCFEGYLFTK